jgi:AraC-like DNA-binding protein
MRALTHNYSYLFCLGLFLYSTSLTAANKPPIGEIYARYYYAPRHFGSNFMAFQNAFLSMILLMFVVVMIQYWNNRRRAYFYYGLYLLVMFFYFLRTFPPYLYFLFPDLGSFLKFYNFLIPQFGEGFSQQTELIFFFLMTAVYLLFVRDFFDFAHEDALVYKRINQIVKVLLGTAILAALILGFTGAYLRDSVLLKYLCFLPMLWLMYKMLKMGLNCTGLIVAGSSMLILGSIVVGVLHLVGDELFGKRIYLEMGVLLEVIFFMAALSRLNWLMIQEKKKLEEDLNVLKRQAFAPQEEQPELLIRLNELIEEVLAVLASGQETKFSMASFAKQLYLSPSALLRKIKEIDSSLSVEEYVLSYRLNKAYELVWKTNTTFSKIATQTGFANQSAFGKAFKKKFGYSPSILRNDGGKNLN